MRGGYRVFFMFLRSTPNLSFYMLELSCPVVVFAALTALCQLQSFSVLHNSLDAQLAPHQQLQLLLPHDVAISISLVPHSVLDSLIQDKKCGWRNLRCWLKYSDNTPAITASDPVTVQPRIFHPSTVQSPFIMLSILWCIQGNHWPKTHTST